MESRKYMDLSDGECIFCIYPSLTEAEEDQLTVIASKLTAIQEHVKTLSQNYIWHNDQWEIKVKNALRSDEPLCFTGVLSFGDNIEDEWFMVYILKELTKAFEDLVISICDSDGEFLLIEAAEHLPSWVSPESSEGRVFLHKGHLHILPQSFLPVSEDSEDSPRVSEELLNFVRSRPMESRVDQAVENAIEERIGGYPEKKSAFIHNAVLSIPVAVAAILDKEPNLVTSAVRAFCERDLIDVKACRAMKYFPPEEVVLSKVKFTKCSYAMLASSKYKPDERTGWKIPPQSDEAYKATFLGIRLACGFEILLSQARSSNKSNSEDIDLSNDRGWLKMLDRLKEMNYFRGLLEHSKQYNQLLNTAQEFYTCNCDKSPTKKGPGALISQVLETTEIDTEALKKRGATLSATDNDDSWMEVSKDELDEMLKKRFGRTEKSQDNPDIVQNLKYFMNHVSDFGGVEFPNGANAEPMRPPRGVKKGTRKNVQFSSDTKTSSKGDGSNKPAPVHIDPDGFMQAVKNILDFSIPDDNSYWNSDDSDMSSYEDEDDLELAGAETVDSKMTEYFKEMDQELATTTMGQSFVKKSNKQTKPTADNFEDAEDFEPVDIDMNALKNILLSYKTQMGEAGPSENILGPLGVNLQDIDADVD